MVCRGLCGMEDCLVCRELCVCIVRIGEIVWYVEDCMVFRGLCRM